MIEFETMYTKDTNSYSSECGKPTLQEYEYGFDKDGHKMLVKKKSQINVYERIQADADSVDINKLMERFALGDTEAINIQKGEFIDARNMPKTYAEVFAKGLEAEQYFESLPVELKEMFDNSYTVFFEEMGNDSFDKKVAKYNDRFIDHSYDTNSSPDPERSNGSEVSYNE